MWRSESGVPTKHYVSLTFPCKYLQYECDIWDNYSGYEFKDETMIDCVFYIFDDICNEFYELSEDFDIKIIKEFLHTHFQVTETNSQLDDDELCMFTTDRHGIVNCGYYGEHNFGFIPEQIFVLNDASTIKN